MVVTLRAEVGTWEAGKWREGDESVDHKQAAAALRGGKVVAGWHRSRNPPSQDLTAK